MPMGPGRGDNARIMVPSFKSCGTPEVPRGPGTREPAIYEFPICVVMIVQWPNVTLQSEQLY